MGTSSIYKGPKDKSPLLPDDFKFEEPDKVEIRWKDAKTSMSQYITGRGTSKERVVRNHVKASGGSKAASKQLVSGRKSTANLGRFLTGIRDQGLVKTLKTFRLEYEGKSVETLLSEIVNVISPESSSKEDAIARKATVEIMSQLYTFIEENNLDFNSLETIDTNMIDQIMTNYISTYIFEKMLNDLQSSFEKYTRSPDQAVEKEREFSEYIQTSVEVRLKNIELGKIDYADTGIDNIIESIYADCYEVLEGCL